MNPMMNTSYFNTADPTTGSNAQRDKILNMGNTDPLSGEGIFPSYHTSGDPLDAGFYAPPFSADPQYSHDLPTTGPVENLFEDVLPGGISTESNLNETPDMRLSVAQRPAERNNVNKVDNKGRYTVDQKRILEQAYNSDPNPSNEKIGSLANQTNLTYFQIMNWFVRRRKQGDQRSNDSSDESSVASNGDNEASNRREDENKPTRTAETILAPYIDQSGGISRIEHMSTCHRLMQQEKSLEQRLFMVTVLSESSVNPLRYFAFDLNGLAILDEWLQQYRKENKVLMIRKILKVLTKTPVNLDLLTKTSIGKTVNSLVKKSTDEKSKELGKALVDKWKQLVQTEPNQSARSTTPEQTRRTPSPQPLRSSANSRPPATAVRPTPVHSNGIEASDDFEAQLGDRPKRKTSLGFDHLRRPKHGSQLRGDSLQDEDRLKRIGTSAPSRPISTDDIKRKKVQTQIMREAIGGSLNADTSHGELHLSPDASSEEGDEPAAKRRKLSSDRDQVTQARPSSPTLNESDVEMIDSNSVNTNSHYNSHSVEELDSDLADQAVDSEMSTDKPSGTDFSLPLSPPMQTTPIIDEGSMTPRLADSEDAETPPSKKKKRKGLNVRWAPDEQLTQIRLFDKEEASVHAQRDFKSAARAEHSNEKQSNEVIKKQEEDEWTERSQNMAPTIVWQAPVPIDFKNAVRKIASPDSEEAGRLSQREQEQMIVSYWNDAQIPANPKDAPAEPGVGPAPEPIAINFNVPITFDSLTQLLSNLQNKVSTAKPAPVTQQPIARPPMQQQQQPFNPAQLLFNNNMQQQQQFMPPQLMQQQQQPQQNIQNLLLSLAGQGLLTPLLAVAQQQQQMAPNPLLNFQQQQHNLSQAQHQQQYAHHQGGRGGYNNNAPHSHGHAHSNHNQNQGYDRGRGGYDGGRGGYDRGRGGHDRGRGQSRGGNRGHHRGGYGGYNKN